MTNEEMSRTYRDHNDPGRFYVVETEFVGTYADSVCLWTAYVEAPEVGPDACLPIAQGSTVSRWGAFRQGRRACRAHSRGTLPHDPDAPMAKEYRL